MPVPLGFAVVTADMFAIGAGAVIRRLNVVIAVMRRRVQPITVLRVLLPCVSVAVGVTAAPAAATGLVAGVNIVNPMRASEGARSVLIDELRAAGVHLVRCGLTDDPAGIAFAKALQAAGIRIDLIVGLRYPPGAPGRPFDQARYPGMWGGHPLSAADPDLSKAALQSLLGKLDAAGVALAGIEVGNEINWTAFNPEFPLPGEGKVLGLADLANDPEGRRIAGGYLRYLQVLTTLKLVRDASTFNHATPIISAGLSSVGPARTIPPGGSRIDGVTIDATLQFLRMHGLDRLVDAYGVHIYPWQAQAEAREQAILSDDVSRCGQSGGKPCWITEWGFDNVDLSCPLNDDARAGVVAETAALFRRLGPSRIARIIFFSWSGDPWAKKTDVGAIYRCGSLTSAGRAALLQQ